MSYIVNDRIEVSIFINDVEYPLDAINLLNWLHIATTVRHSLPVLGFQIDDVQHVIDRIGLLDGAPIRVVVKPNGKNSRTYVFRKFNSQRVFTGENWRWTIYGYWDAPLYWAGTSVKALEGTASNVLQEIASTCGLKYDGPTTNDSQIWVPRNRTYRAWAKDIVAHTWVSDTSCMIFGVDLDGTMRLRNINDLPEPQVKIVAYTFAEDALTASDVSLNASSGLNNALSGYNSMRVSQSVTADETQIFLEDLSFTPDVKNPHYNQQLKTELERGAVRFGPIDCGNVHENYEKADYQNLRYRNLFSYGIDAMMIDVNDILLGDRVNLAIQTETTKQDVPNSGVYTVSGHAIYVQGAQYQEKLGMCRHGTNEVPQ
jgi:hypothetical protein